MKKLMLYFFFASFFVTTVFSQTAPICNFGEGFNRTPPANWHFSTLLQDQQGIFDNTTFCVNIKVHIVRQTSGTGGVNPTNVMNQMNNVIPIFNSEGINLIWDNSINYIDDSYYYTNFDQLLTSSHASTDRIDIFFANIFETGGSGSSITSTGIYIIPEQLNSSIIAHEIGHQFGLVHTYHGTSDDTFFPLDNDPYDVVETAFNGCCAGDWVKDTLPDNGGLRDTGGGFLCLSVNQETGWVYQPSNFMTNSYASCRNTFTDGQVTRMKYFLDNSTSTGAISPHLGLAIAACPAPSFCTGDNCKPAENAAREIFFKGFSGDPLNPPYLFMQFNSSSSVTFNNMMSANLTECNLEFYVSYDGGDNFVALTTSGLPQTAITSSDLSVILKVVNLDNNDKTCCYSRSYSTSEPTFPNNMSILEVDCPIDIACENPCDLEADYTYQSIGLCSYQFDAIVDLPCSVDEYWFQWYVNGNYHSSGLTSIINFDGMSNPKVGLLVIKNVGIKCTQVDKILSIFCFSPSLSLIPNPSKFNEELNFEGIDYKEVSSIGIYDMIGNLKQSIKPKRNSFKIERLTSGMYFIKFITNQGIIQKKIIIE